MTLRPEFGTSERESHSVACCGTRFGRVAGQRDNSIMFKDTCRNRILDADLVLSPSPTFSHFDTTLTGPCGEFVVTGLTPGNDVSVLQMSGFEIYSVVGV